MGSVAIVPSWLYDLFGVVMLAIAAYSLAIIASGVRSRHTSGWDIELSHAVEGVSMAGMFVGGWGFRPSGLWEGVFGALLVWFVIRTGRSIQAYGLHLPHTAVHVLMSFAMLLIYWYPKPMGRAATSGVPAVPAVPAVSAVSAHSRADPGVLLVVAVLLLASAIFTMASHPRGGSVLGTHAASAGVSTTGVSATGVSTVAVSTVAVAVPSQAYVSGTAAPAGRIEGAVPRPGLLDATHVAMCVAMAFMLILVL